MYHIILKIIAKTCLGVTYKVFNSMLADPFCQIQFFCAHPQTKPDEFNERNDPHPEDQTEQTSDVGEVIDPSLSRLTAHLKDGRLVEEDLDKGDVGIVGVICFCVGCENISVSQSLVVGSYARHHSTEKSWSQVPFCIFSLDLSCKFGRLRKGFVVQVAEPADAKVAGITSSERNSKR